MGMNGRRSSETETREILAHGALKKNEKEWIDFIPKCLEIVKLS